MPKIEAFILKEFDLTASNQSSLNPYASSGSKQEVSPDQFQPQKKIYLFLRVCKTMYQHQFI